MTQSRSTAQSAPKLIAVVPARMSSARLPGKILRFQCGHPMLLYTIERLRSVEQLDQVVIATSTAPADDPIEIFAKKYGVYCWRGPLNDVLTRIWEVAVALNAEAVMRVSGDSPLIDPALIRTAIELFLEHRPNLVTNVFPRSFPKGQSVEILSRSSLDRLKTEARDTADREHVTRYAYAHPDRYMIRNFTARQPRPDLQLSVDTQEDFERVEALLAATGPMPDFATVERLIELTDAKAAVR
jgi:spore coat polysaccharide biosynthesis protein SpsF (cytidylyltransferase family)